MGRSGPAVLAPAIVAVFLIRKILKRFRVIDYTVFFKPSSFKSSNLAAVLNRLAVKVPRQKGGAKTALPNSLLPYMSACQKKVKIVKRDSNKQCPFLPVPNQMGFVT